jgi:predicted methyltransferase
MRARPQNWLAALLLALSATAAPAADEPDRVAAALAADDRLAADIERDGRDHPAAILNLLNIGPGDRVADIFAGGGYYSELIGRVVAPDGVVLMHNNAPYVEFAAKGIAERFEGREVGNVVRHDREPDDLDLGQDNLDAVIIIMSYHDLFYVDESWPAIDADNFIGQIAAALKPGGRFLIVDHVATTGSGNSAAQELHRIDPAFARAHIEAQGLRYIAGSDVLRRADDDYTLFVFDPAIRGKTDRFVQVYKKP